MLTDDEKRFLRTCCEHLGPDLKAEIDSFSLRAELLLDPEEFEENVANTLSALYKKQIELNTNKGNSGVFHFFSRWNFNPNKGISIEMSSQAYSALQGPFGDLLFSVPADDGFQKLSVGI